MPSATYALAVNWSGDGSTWVDETALVVSLHWSHGRDYASQLTGRSSAGELTARLQNIAGRFNSFNTASALAGNLLPGRQVRLQMTSNASTSTMFLGLLDSIQPAPVVGGLSYATLRAVGPLAWMEARRINVAMQTAVRSDNAIAEVLDQAGWSTTLRTLDAGNTTFGRWWTGGRITGLNALREVEDSEHGFLREGKNGAIVWENRQHRLLGAHTTPQAVYSDAAGATLPYQAIFQQDPLREIYNRIEARVKRYTSGSLAVLWTHPEAVSTTSLISLAPGESKTFWARYPNPDSSADAVAVDAWTTPASNTDFLANTSFGGGDTSCTSNLTVAVSKFDTAMKITLTNGAPPAPFCYLTLLQARGIPVSVQDPIEVVAESTGSQASYGQRSYPVPGPWVPNSAEALDYVNYVLGIYKDPIPVVAITALANDSSGWLDEARTRDVSDRVTLVANSTTLAGTNLGINGDFFVERISHDVTRESVHRVTLELSPASGYGRVIVLDVGPALNVGILGY